MSDTRGPGLDVRWSDALGYVRFVDPFSGDAVEVATADLRAASGGADLTWLVQRARAARGAAGAARPQVPPVLPKAKRA